MDLLRRQAFLARPDGPAESERIGDDAVAVAPKLIGQRHVHFAAGRDGLFENRIGIGHIEVKVERQTPLRQRRLSEFRAKIVAEHQERIANPHLCMRQFAAGARGTADFNRTEGALQELDVVGCSLNMQMRRDGVEAGRYRRNGCRHADSIPWAPAPGKADGNRLRASANELRIFPTARPCYNFFVARVLMVSSEAAPLAKTGGLADVVGSLPRALAALGHEVAVVIPRYRSIDLAGMRRVWDAAPVHFGPDRYDVSIYQAPDEFPFYLIDCPPLFGRKGYYGEAGLDYPDNHIRFAVFARSALNVARYLFRTEIFHCHDWQAGLVAPYLKTTFASDPTFMGARTLFTIHNLGYQGLFDKPVMAEVALDASLFRPDGMEFFGRLSYIKGGISYADALNTVSPSYAREIQTPEFGFGLDGALRSRSGVLSGILNGADYGEWNPETDPHLPARYSAEDLAGKRVCKERLLAEFGLPEEAISRPLLGIISRFTRQKGADMLAETIDRIVAEDLYLVALGTGDPEYEEFFQRMAAAHPERVAVRIAFDNALAHRIEAGADMFLMPSRYEPCGLNQIYSLRYGTIPVVRGTGGLNDTIEEGTGFKFAGYSGVALWDAVGEAVAAYSNGEQWTAMMRRAMGKDFSWHASACAYSDLYKALRRV